MEDEQNPAICTWIPWYPVDMNTWDTQCGNAHRFIEGDPGYNLYQYCPYCGNKIQTQERATDGEHAN